MKFEEMTVAFAFLEEELSPLFKEMMLHGNFRNITGNRGPTYKNKRDSQSESLLKDNN